MAGEEIRIDPHAGFFGAIAHSAANAWFFVSGAILLGAPHSLEPIRCATGRCSPLAEATVARVQPAAILADMFARVITLAFLFVALLAGGLAPVAAAPVRHAVTELDVAASWPEHGYPTAEIQDAADQMQDALQTIATAIANVVSPPRLAQWRLPVGEVCISPRRFLPDEPPRQVADQATSSLFASRKRAGRLLRP